uniref:Uncharacterized protein n=1 Tax=Odontella aurita TaxID=265563 RepID=A0A7S4JFW8_9STRA|mmetsp:Transcript_459/g.1397  ORF Transcript_459/g.1397 Transcript_459/m.1397 type:complete len:102 (+) Transcript_459:614-919(+)
MFFVMQLPTSQAPLMQGTPTAHGVPGDKFLPKQTAPAEHVSSAVHSLPSSHRVPTSTSLNSHCPSPYASIGKEKTHQSQQNMKRGDISLFLVRYNFSSSKS